MPRVMMQVVMMVMAKMLIPPVPPSLILRHFHDNNANLGGWRCWNGLRWIMLWNVTLRAANHPLLRWNIPHVQYSSHFPIMDDPIWDSIHSRITIYISQDRLRSLNHLAFDTAAWYPKPHSCSPSPLWDRTITPCFSLRPETLVQQWSP